MRQKKIDTTGLQVDGENDQIERGEQENTATNAVVKIRGPPGVMT